MALAQYPCQGAWVTRTAVLGALAVVLFALPDFAVAGTYEVRSCAASASFRSEAWRTELTPAEPLDARDWCATNDAGTDGRVVFTRGRFLRNPLPPPAGAEAHLGRTGRLVFSAPAEAVVKRISYSRRLQSLDAGWEVRLKAGSDVLEACVQGPNDIECPDPGNGSFAATLDPGVASVELGIWCVDAVCPFNPGSLHDVAAVIYSSVVTIEENVAPTAAAPNVTGTNPSGWLNANATAALSGSDTLGLRRLEVVDTSDGNRVVGTVTNTGCVDWSVLPCSDTTVAGLGPGFGGSTALAALTDGTHQLRTRAVDAAGNQTLSGGAATTVKVDRTAPVATPVTQGATLIGETTTFEWTGPAAAQVAPITSGRLRVCRGPNAASLTCTWKTGVGQAGQSSVALGNDGDLTTVAVELTDQAGNVGLSPTVEFRRDTTAPGAPQLSERTGSGTRRVIDVATSDTDVAGYAVRLCGPNGCADSRSISFGFVELDLPAVGTYRADVALVDRAGNVGPAASVALERAADTVDPGPSTPTTPPPGTTPPGTTPPEAKTAIKLTVRKPIRPGVGTVTLRGTVQAGAASAITVSVTGRPRGRKRAVTRRTTAKPRATGGWTVRAALPAGVPRRSRLVIKVTATPTSRYRAASATFSRRR